MSTRPAAKGSITFADVPVYHLGVNQILNELRVDPKSGLSDEQVVAYREEYGNNIIAPPKGRTWWMILLGQLLNAITFILLACVVVTAVNHEYIDMTVIIGIIVLNAAIGFASELKSQGSLEALMQMSKGVATVLRNGKTEVVDIDDVVVGDVLVLKSGDIIPADARVIAEANLELDEASLTGESVTIYKGTEAIPIPPSTPGLDVRVAVGDRVNMIFRQTICVGGTGAAIVTATGYDTAIGRISKRLNATSGPTKTKFQKALDLFMYILFGVALFLAFLIICIVKFKVNEEVIVYAASTAIALLPEALIMVTTISLSLGMSRLAAKRAIVSKMNVLTEVGSLTACLSDKTGTLTLGEMVCKRIWPYGSEIVYHVSGGGRDLTAGFGVEYDAASLPQDSKLAENIANTRAARAATRATTRAQSLHGSIHQHQNDVNQRFAAPSFDHNVMKIATGLPECELPAVQQACEQLALVMALNNNTMLQVDEENDRLVGDGGNPTEVALTVCTHKLGMPSTYFEDNYGWQRAGQFAFDSSSKRMSTGICRVVTDEQGQPTGQKESLILTKGAPEAILPICTNIRIEEVLPRVDALAAQGFRVLACAIGNHIELDDVDGKRLHDHDRTIVEAGLTFVGLCVVFDPPRDESFVAVQTCKDAGITFVMVTGDHHATAENISRRLGILEPHHGPERISTGPIIDSMTDEQLDQWENLPLCVGRCSPETKVKLVEAFQRRGGVVSVTGDGVNDVAAISASNCGFAMGLAGTEFTKQSADIVLADDNIATMINAIESGRHLHTCIKRFVVHLLSSNVAEVIILLLGLIWRDASGEVVFPLSALEILTINLITSSPPAIGLTLDPVSPDTMKQPPSNGAFFTPEVILDMGVTGSVMGVLSLVSYLLVIFVFGDGGFGLACNKADGRYTCDLVWEARTTAYATLYMLLLVQGYVCRHARNSVFSQPLFDNKVLIASFIGGALFLQGTIYIPAVAHKLYKHAPITWEWAMVVINMVLYLAITELYKLIKRFFLGTPGAKPKSHDDLILKKKGHHVTSDGGMIEIQ